MPLSQDVNFNFISRHLPIDGYIFFIPDTAGDYVRFHGYGRSIRKAGFVYVARQAMSDLHDHSRTFNSKVTTPLIYKDQEDLVALRVVPIDMTWQQWSQALNVIKDFYHLWDPVTLKFDIVRANDHQTMGAGKVQYGFWDGLTNYSAVA